MIFALLLATRWLGTTGPLTWFSFSSARRYHQFLNVLRAIILALQELRFTFMNRMASQLSPARPTICVFCGSSHGADPIYTETARAFGTGMVKAGFDLVFGGGGVGLMGGQGSNETAFCS